MIALLLALTAFAADPWDASVAQAWAAHPELGDAVWQADPRPTRAGFLRFADDATGNPDAVPFLADRLAIGDDGPAVRRALADSVGRAQPDWVPALLDGESDPGVRTALISHLRRADAAVAVPALRAALTDPDPAVRAEAALTAGMHADGRQLLPALRTATDDDAHIVRANAIQVLGWLGDDASAATAQRLLADTDPLVRKRAAGALERLGR